MNFFGEFLGEILGAGAVLILGVLYQRARRQLARLGQGRIAVSPNQQAVAFEVDGEVYVSDRAGTRNLTRHKAQDNFALWAPDSRLLAFASERQGGWQVWVADTRTGKLACLTSGPGSKRPLIWDDNTGDLIISLGGSAHVIFYGEIQRRLT